MPKELLTIPVRLGYVTKAHLVKIVFGDANMYRKRLLYAKLSEQFRADFEPYTSKREIPVSLFRLLWEECELGETLDYQLIDDKTQNVIAASTTEQAA